MANGILACTVVSHLWNYNICAMDVGRSIPQFESETKHATSGVIEAPSTLAFHRSRAVHSILLAQWPSTAPELGTASGHLAQWPSTAPELGTASGHQSKI